MILQNFFDEKLQLPNIKVKRVYRVANKQNSKKKNNSDQVRKFGRHTKGSFRNPETKGTNININEDHSKETLEIRKENWKTIKELREKMVCMLSWSMIEIVTKRKYRKQQVFIEIFP